MSMMGLITIAKLYNSFHFVNEVATMFFHGCETLVGYCKQFGYLILQILRDIGVGAAFALRLRKIRRDY